MTKYKVEYLHVKLDSIEIEASCPEDAIAKFNQANKKTDKSIYSGFHAEPIVESEEASQVKSAVNGKSKVYVGPTSTEVDEDLVYDFKISKEDKKISTSSAVASLSPREYDLLMYFTDDLEAYLTTEDIEHEVFNGDATNSKSVSSLVSKLRRKIRLANSNVKVEFTKGQGYRLKYN